MVHDTFEMLSLRILAVKSIRQQLAPRIGSTFRVSPSKAMEKDSFMGGRLKQLKGCDLPV